jgi:hypothetical protein
VKVTLFRDLLTERWWSMERYADELFGALTQMGCDVRSFVAARPEGFPEAAKKRGGAPGTASWIPSWENPGAYLLSSFLPISTALAASAA